MTDLRRVFIFMQSICMPVKLALKSARNFNQYISVAHSLESRVMLFSLQR